MVGKMRKEMPGWKCRRIVVSLQKRNVYVTAHHSVCTVLATPAQAAPLQEEVQPAPAQDTLRLDWGTYIGKLPAGQGKLYHKERGLYVGTFDKVVPSGKGIHIQADGSVYTGNFVRGAYRGYGRLFRATGAVICGEFSSGRANGLDTLYYPDGKVFIGIMQNNGPTKQGKTYKSADAAKLTRPQKPALPLTAEDEAFLQSLGYGAYDTPATFGKGAVPPFLTEGMYQEWILGCDNCQDACPHNRRHERHVAHLVSFSLDFQDIETVGALPPQSAHHLWRLQLISVPLHFYYEGKRSTGVYCRCIVAAGVAVVGNPGRWC